MTDVFSRRKRSAVMARIRSTKTMPETLMQTALRRQGKLFLCNVASLPGRPDIVFSQERLVVQVLGCFWHGHSCIDGHIPWSRRKYWIPKLRGNKKRDRRNATRLRGAGWRVLTVWECQCKKEGLLNRH